VQEREKEIARDGLLLRTSRFASPERKFSTNALCTLGLRRIGRAIPTTATVYARNIALMRVGRVVDNICKGQSYFVQIRCESRDEVDNRKSWEYRGKKQTPLIMSYYCNSISIFVFYIRTEVLINLNNFLNIYELLDSKN